MTNPLWLPRGSIRALLTLSVAFTTLIMVIMAREQIPQALGNVLIVSVAFYYSTRAITPLSTVEAKQVDEVTPPPLFLPTRTVRVTLAATIILAAAITFLKDQQIPIFMITVLVTILGYVLGAVIKKLIIKIFPPKPGQQSKTKELIEHFQAGVILMVVIGVCGINILSTIIPVDMGQEILVNQVLELAIGYYFGSRTIR